EGRPLTYSVQLFVRFNDEQIGIIGDNAQHDAIDKSLKAHTINLILTDRIWRHGVSQIYATLLFIESADHNKMARWFPFDVVVNIELRHLPGCAIQVGRT